MENKTNIHWIDDIKYHVSNDGPQEIKKVSEDHTILWPSENVEYFLEAMSTKSIEFIPDRACLVFTKKDNKKEEFNIPNFLTYRKDFLKIFSLILEICSRHGIGFSTKSFSVPCFEV